MLKDIIIPGLTLIVLIVTLVIYWRLLNVSNKTLKFTKRQTQFNLHFDNYKFFYDLSKRKTDILYPEEISYINVNLLYENLTFGTMYFTYNNLFQKFPSNISFERKVFKRFNDKIQLFLDMIYEEITNIENDVQLKNKKIFIDFYVNTILTDYINTSKLLIKELEQIENKTNGLKSFLKLGTENLLKYEEDGIKIFSPNEFLKLYYKINKSKKLE